MHTLPKNNVFKKWPKLQAKLSAEYISDKTFSVFLMEFKSFYRNFRRLKSYPIQFIFAYLGTVQSLSYNMAGGGEKFLQKKSARPIWNYCKKKQTAAPPFPQKSICPVFMNKRCCIVPPKTVFVNEKISTLETKRYDHRETRIDW